MDPDPAQELRHRLAGSLPPGAGQVEGTGGEQTDQAGEAGGAEDIDLDDGGRGPGFAQASFGRVEQ